MAKRQREVRALLHAYPEGLTTRQIADMLDADLRTMHFCLKAMVDTYVIGWASGKGKPQALWAAVVVPEDYPRPPKTEKSIRESLR
jgi:hypothetical protein